ncbi:sodium/proline symporter PutP, partial [Vibrio lentus]
MLAALFFCMLLGYMAIADSPVMISDIKPDAFKFSTSFITGASLMAWGFGYFGQPHILARFIGIDKVENIAKARRVGISWMILTLVISVSIALIG